MHKTTERQGETILENLKRVRIFKVSALDMANFVNFQPHELKVVGRGCPSDAKVTGVCYEPDGEYYYVKAVSARFSKVKEAESIWIQEEFVRIELV